MTTGKPSLFGGLTLRQAASRAAILTVGSHFVSQLLRFAGNLVLARILAPEDFGLMLLAIAVWVGLHMLTDVGFRQVVVRSPNADDPVFLNTLWTMQVVQGAAVSALMLVAALALAAAAGSELLAAANTLSNPQLPGILAFLSLAALLGSFQSINIDLAGRSLRLGTLSAIELGSQALALSVTVAAATLTKSVHALVLGACCAAACKTACSHFFLPGPTHRFRLSRPAVAEILSFGQWIVVTSWAGYVVSNGDRLLLGSLLTPREMGNYAIAVLIAFAVHEVVAKLVAGVVYPVISAAGGQDRAALRRAYLRARCVIDAICLAAAAFLIAFGDRIVHLLYDDRYAEGGTYLRILAISLVGIRYRVLAQVFLVIGRPRLMLYEHVLHTLSLAIGILAGLAYYGTFGAVCGVAASYLVAQLWNVTRGQSSLGLLSWRHEAAALGLFGIALAGALFLRNVLFVP